MTDQPQLARLTHETYSAWYEAICTSMCGWNGPKAGQRAFVLAGVKRHAREMGHETALIRTVSVHYRRIASSEDRP